MVDVKLYLGDCLTILPTLADRSVDAIITDLPYGTTACKWDSVIPFEPMWREVKRLLKPHGAFATTASQPFTSMLVMSNLEWFRYEWIWDKVMVSNFPNAKKEPLRNHEAILVFADGLTIYNPQLGQAGKPFGKLSRTDSDVVGHLGNNYATGVGYPKTILKFARPNNITGGGLHPTQKPAALCEYLIRTYTDEGNIVLDFCMGSGTTGVACVQTGRDFVGIEIMPEYYKIATRRIAEAQQQLRLPEVEHG